MNTKRSLRGFLSILVTLALSSFAINTAKAQPDVPLFYTMITKPASNLWAQTLATTTSIRTNFVSAQIKTNQLRFGRGIAVMAAAYIYTNGIGVGSDAANTNAYIDFELSLDRTNWTSAGANAAELAGVTVGKPLRMVVQIKSGSTPTFTLTNFSQDVIGNYRYIRPGAWGPCLTNNVVGNVILSNLWMSINYAP